MRPPRTPWANTLRITGPIFIHDEREGKLSQVAYYVTDWVRRGLPRHARPAVSLRQQIISSARGNLAQPRHWAVRQLVPCWLDSGRSVRSAVSPGQLQ